MRSLMLAAVFFISTSFCANNYYENEDGYEIYESSLAYLPVFYQSFDTAYFAKLIERIDKNENNQFSDFKKAQSDKSVALMKLGKIEEAVAILQNLYYNDPSPDYNIIANLGTAYELNGQVDSALILIQKAIEVNEDSHKGSEWFHVKVLEAKQKMAKNKAWIKKNKILDVKIDSVFKKYISPEEIAEGQAPWAYISREFQKVNRDIIYQLKERVPFTPKPDPILANILNEYGDLLAKASIEMAYVVYAVGFTYDENNWYGMDKKASKMLGLITKSEMVSLPSLNGFMPDSAVPQPALSASERIYAKLHDHNHDETKNLTSVTGITFLIVALFMFAVFFGIYRFRKWLKTREVFEQ